MNNATILFIARYQLAPFREETVLEELDQEERDSQAKSDRDGTRAVPCLCGFGTIDEDERDEQQQLPDEAQQVRVREDILPPLVVLALDDLERDEEKHYERCDPVPAFGPGDAGKIEQRCRGNRPDYDKQQEQYPYEP